MHELSITQSLFEIVIKEAAGAGARRVTCVNLIVGELTGVISESVQFFFEFLSKNTPVEGARLNIIRVPAKARCTECGEEFEIKDANWVCPVCQRICLTITAGKELFLESIEIE